jgi:hypothetical protein
MTVLLLKWPCSRLRPFHAFLSEISKLPLESRHLDRIGAALTGPPIFHLHPAPAGRVATGPSMGMVAMVVTGFDLRMYAEQAIGSVL